MSSPAWSASRSGAARRSPAERREARHLTLWLVCWLLIALGAASPLVRRTVRRSARAGGAQVTLTVQRLAQRYAWAGGS